MRRELEKYGAKSSVFPKSQPFYCHWQFQPDDEGFQVHINGDHFAEVDALFHNVYGAPSKLIGGKGQSYPLSLYNVATTGLGIQYGYDAERRETFIIVIKPRDMEEIISAARQMKEAAQEKYVK